MEWTDGMEYQLTKITKTIDIRDVTLLSMPKLTIVAMAKF